MVLVGLGLCLERVRPWPLRFPGSRSMGCLLVVAGAVIAAQATRAAGDVDLADPSNLVTSGPYRFSRHPMYAGWTLGYLGAALVVATAWPVALTPPLAVWIVREVSREERALAEVFGAHHERYRRTVRALV